MTGTSVLAGTALQSGRKQKHQERPPRHLLAFHRGSHWGYGVVTSACS